MRRTALALLAGLAIATTISAPASAMSEGEAYLRQFIDVATNGYEDKATRIRDILKVIEKREDGTVLYELPDGQRVVSPAYEIHTDHDDPYGPCGAFFVEIKAGTKSICVFEGPQVGMSFPAVYETVDGGSDWKDVCTTTRKSIVRPNRGFFGYDIAKSETTVDGACSNKP